MSLQQLKEQAYQLAADDRWELAMDILRSLQSAPAEPTLLESPAMAWQFLVARPHPWRKQLYIKGRKLLASIVWQDMLTNQLTPEAAADNWDLPPAAIAEICQYCEAHRDLIALEAEEERCRLQAQGVSFEPITTAR